LFQDKLREAFKVGRVRWRAHALQRMFERGIFRSDVSSVIEDGNIVYVITAYEPDDAHFGPDHVTRRREE